MSAWNCKTSSNRERERKRKIPISNIVFAVLREYRKIFFILRFSHFICNAGKWTLEEDRKEMIALKHENSEEILAIEFSTIIFHQWNIFSIMFLRHCAWQMVHCGVIFMQIYCRTFLIPRNHTFSRSLKFS